MKIRVRYYSIRSDHLLAIPEFSHSEIVEAEGLNDKKLIDYITSKKDPYGNQFRKLDNSDQDKFVKYMGFDYNSSFGAVAVAKYEKPHVKRL